MTDIVGVSVLPEAHFACQGTGMCCQGYQFGPIDDDVAARILAHPFVENAARIAAAGGPFTTAEVHGEPMRVLSRVNGRCVFLADDGLCVVHKELGAEAKPALCRLYPLNVAVAPDGVAYVSLNMECAGYAQGRQGPPLVDTVEAHLDLVGTLPTLAVPAQVPVTFERAFPYEDVFDAFEAPALEDLDATRDPLALVADLCGRLLGDGPHAEPWDDWPARLPAALTRLAGRVAWRAREVAREEAAAGDPVDADLNRQVAALAEAATHDAALQALPAEGAEILREHLQQVVFGKALHKAPTLAAGVGFEAVRIWLLHTGAPLADAAAVVGRLRALNRVLRPSDLAGVGPDFAPRCEELCEALASR
ncbi:MAG: YkgJ family cysteine cluster protein [Myxococcales bacterium]|nr:YkgJ family cysteine cluster protein [Myxococcales bacterium]MCB9525308.1 YkgJ family cysteine cluster protein [Myxococcales bacterium]